MIICVKSTHTQTQRVKKNTEGGPEEKAPKVFEIENKNKKNELAYAFDAKMFSMQHRNSFKNCYEFMVFR